MIEMEQHCPAGNEEVRRALYGGTIFLLPATPCTLRLVESVLALVRAELGGGESYRHAQFAQSGIDFFHAVGRLRKVLNEKEEIHDAVKDVMTERGFNLAENAFDPPRLRAVMHDGHHNPRAASVYHAHRDTWYAQPQAQVTWWMPLHDVGEEETFVFYADHFDRPVDNDSGSFQHAGWVNNDNGQRIGWQDYDAGLRISYPHMTEDLQARRLGFSSKPGDLLLFSGAHLHQTLPNITGRSRFSIDFRTVHLADHARGLGAPDVDNHQPSDAALGGYLHPPQFVKRADGAAGAREARAS
jgi:hypothetical protein